MYNKFKKLIIPTLATSWVLLGFKRGVNSYDYNYNKRIDKNNKYDINETYLYSDKIAKGILGAFFYINPFLIFFLLPKEIYRLEVYLRNLEKEKTSDYYNDIL